MMRPLKACPTQEEAFAVATRCLLAYPSVAKPYFAKTEALCLSLMEEECEELQRTSAMLFATAASLLGAEQHLLLLRKTLVEAERVIRRLYSPFASEEERMQRTGM